jgi:hypothetical protein
VVADLPAMLSYTYLWGTTELKWAIMEGLVPDIEGQDSTACHQIGRIYLPPPSLSVMHACMYTHTHTHTPFYTSTFTIYYKVYELSKASYHLLERRIRLSAT